MPSRLNIRLNDIFNSVQHVAEGFGLFVQRQLARFDAAHVQHIVDKRKEIIRRTGDGRETILDLSLVVDAA